VLPSRSSGVLGPAVDDPRASGSSTRTERWPTQGCDDAAAISYVDDVQYDALGRRATVVTPAGTRSFAYDAPTQRLARDDFTSRSPGVYSRSLDYVGGDGVASYDGLGNLLEVEGVSSTGAVDLSASYGYDARGRLGWWQKPGVGSVPETPRAHFRYDALGNLVGHGVGESDPPNQLFGEAGGTRPHAVRLRSDLGIAYAYDADGNLAAEAWSDGARYYRFDALSWLACVGASPGACNRLEVDYGSGGMRLREIERVLSARRPALRARRAQRRLRRLSPPPPPPGYRSSRNCSSVSPASRTIPAIV